MKRQLHLAGIVPSIVAVAMTMCAIPASAVSKNCRTLGVSRIENGKLVVCVRVGNKKIWQSATASSSASKTSIRSSQVLAGSDLTRQNLRGINLAGRDISTARMPYADLTGANLSGAFVMSLNLASANLAGANLSKAYGGWLFVNGANLEGANLTNASLVHSNFDAYVAENGFMRVNLEGATLTSATLRGSTFEQARLDRTSARLANFEDSNFANASIQNADLAGANFQGSDLFNANFSGSTLGSDWRLQFRGARFENTTWVDGRIYSTTPDSP
jgi:uncharacterized protein YjbI with pentapeptide repeats